MKILSILKYDLIKLSRSKMYLVFMLIMPIVFSLVFGSVNFSSNEKKIPIGVLNMDEGSEASLIIEEMKRDSALEVKEQNETEIFNQVKNVDTEAGFIFGKDFSSRIASGNSPEVQIIKLPSSVDYMMIENKINNIFEKARIKEKAVNFSNESISDKKIAYKDLLLSEISSKVDENMKNDRFLTLKTSIFYKGTREASSNSQFLLGFMIMFVMFTVIFSCGEILEEKKNNTWERLNITSTALSTIFTGKILASFVRGWIQIAVLIIIGKLLGSIDWGNSLLIFCMSISAFLLCIAGLGIFLSSFIKTNAQLGSVSAVIITASSMLAGCYWPLEIVPFYMQKLAQVFPQYWAIKSISSAMNGMYTFNDIMVPILVLLGMGVLLFLLGILGVRSLDKNYKF